MGDEVLVYDDDCGFCTWWADFIDARSDFPIVGFSEVDPALADRLPADYEDCSHMVTDDGVYSCGASIEEALARADVGPATRSVVDRLRTVGTYETAREWGYRHVAENRSLLGRLMSKTPPARRERSGGDDG